MLGGGGNRGARKRARREHQRIFRRERIERSVDRAREEFDRHAHATEPRRGQRIRGAFDTQTGSYQDTLKAAIKALSASASEHDIYKNPAGYYVRRDLEVSFKLTESAHCELAIHRDSKVTYSGARGALGPESPDPAKFYEIPLGAMVKDLVRKNE